MATSFYDPTQSWDTYSSSAPNTSDWWNSYVSDSPSYLDANMTSPATSNTIDFSSSSPSTNWWDSIGAYDPNLSLAETGTTGTDAGSGSTGIMAALNKFLGLGSTGGVNGKSNELTLASLLGAGLPAGLGALASSNQTDKLTALSEKYSAMGQPYRDKLSALYTDPSTFLNSDAVRIPVQQGTDMLARSLSTHGNPTGSGNALTELQKYSSGQLSDRLGQEKDRLAGFGGLSSYSGAAPAAATSAINSSANTYNAIGAGAADIFNPKPATSLADLLKLMKG